MRMTGPLSSLLSAALCRCNDAARAARWGREEEEWGCRVCGIIAINQTTAYRSAARRAAVRRASATRAIRKQNRSESVVPSVIERQKCLCEARSAAVIARDIRSVPADD